MNPWKKLKRMIRKMFGRQKEQNSEVGSIGTISSDVYKPLDWTLEGNPSFDSMFNSLSMERSPNVSTTDTNVQSGGSEMDDYYRRISAHQFEEDSVEYVPTRSLETLHRQKSKIKKAYKREGVVCERSSEEIEHVLPVSSNLQQIGNRLIFKFHENFSDVAFSSDEEDW